LKKVRHEHIVSLHDIYESTDAVYIITDICTGGELFQRIVERGTYTEAIAADLVRQMLEGLAYLHSQGVSIFASFDSFPFYLNLKTY
jgi:calcium/calmodulin-dependent protein kinase I